MIEKIYITRHGESKGCADRRAIMIELKSIQVSERDGLTRFGLMLGESLV
jgi:hypothetical protein